MNSPKKAELSKAVLNVTTYKEDPEGKFPPVAQYETIDITGLLEERGITSVCSVNGAWSVDDDEFTVEYAVTDPELRALCQKVTDILDIAIVNEKQNKALKRLIENEFNDFIEEHWIPVRDCAETRDYIDEALRKAMEGEK